MPGNHDIEGHLGGTLHDRIEVVNLKPEQNSVPIRFVLTIAYRAMMMFYVETMQLKDKLAI